MAEYVCQVCGYVYVEEREGLRWEDLPDDWLCPVCGSGRACYKPLAQEGAPTSGDGAAAPAAAGSGGALAPGDLERPFDERETFMKDIHRMAEKGESLVEPMRTSVPTFTWDELLILGAQLSRIPLNQDEPVSTQTVLGPGAKTPLVIDTPVYITHMSFGALSREAKIALAQGSAAMRTAMCSGEGGILPEVLAAAHAYIFEYVPNRYSVTEENLRRVDAVEIKIGQSAKPGMGGHLPAAKVTEEIAAIRGFPLGVDIHSPARFDDIRTPEDLRRTVAWLREATGGKPVGVKLAAGRIEADLDVALFAGPDFVTIDGRAGATGAASKFVKASASVPTIFALHRARKHLDARGARDVSLLITGGLRISGDFAKALALGADAVAIGSAARMALGCQQYRMCVDGKCPVGIGTQDPALRARLDIDEASRRLANYLRVCTEELKSFARLTGNDDVHGLTVSDLCTTSSEISDHTDIAHV